jgi:hypothetical protein
MEAGMHIDAYFRGEVVGVNELEESVQVLTPKGVTVHVYVGSSEQWHPKIKKGDQLECEQAKAMFDNGILLIYPKVRLDVNGVAHEETP